MKQSESAAFSSLVVRLCWGHFHCMLFVAVATMGVLVVVVVAVKVVEGCASFPMRRR
jgi:hypothetical protein